MDSKVVFHCLGMPKMIYFKKFVIPVFALSVVFPFIMILLAPSVVQGYTLLGVILVPFFLMIAIFLYPIMSMEGKKKR